MNSRGMALVAALALSACSSSTTCTLVSVHDGDTFTCAPHTHIRLHSYDAPELPGSPACRGARAATHWCDDPIAAVAAHQALVDLFASSTTITIQPTGDRSYNRIVADVYADNTPVGPYLYHLHLAHYEPQFN